MSQEEEVELQSSETGSTLRDASRQASSLQESKIKGVSISRYKGLGEMNPEQLWDTTMNPENRTLYQVKIEDVQDADRVFDVLMGSEVAPRKKFIQSHAQKVENIDI